MKTCVLPVLLTRSPNVSIFIASLVNSNRNLTGGLVHLPGKSRRDVAKTGQEEASPPTIRNVQPRGRNIINDQFVASKVLCTCDWQVEQFGYRDSRKED